MARFMQTDPIGFGGGMNLYAYVGNNPVNFTDPMGLCSFRLMGHYEATQGDDGKPSGPWKLVYTYMEQMSPCGGDASGPLLFDGGVGTGGGSGVEDQDPEARQRAFRQRFRANGDAQRACRTIACLQRELRNQEALMRTPEFQIEFERNHRATVEAFTSLFVALGAGVSAFRAGATLIETIFGIGTAQSVEDLIEYIVGGGL